MNINYHSGDRKNGNFDNVTLTYKNNTVTPKLTVRAKTGESVRIWYSDVPDSMCGLYPAADLLKDFECHVSAVKLPTYMPRGEQEVESAVFWGELMPGKFAQYLTLETEIPHSVQKAIAMEWEQLKREKASLRVVLDGRLHPKGNSRGHFQGRWNKCQNRMKIST